MLVHVYMIFGHSLQANSCLLAPDCMHKGIFLQLLKLLMVFVTNFVVPCIDTTGDSEVAAVISGVVCSVVFLSVGVLLGALLHRLFCTPHTHTHSHKPPSPPAAVVYEEVEKASADIELNFNEAYGPISQHHIPTTHNPAHTHVRL